MLVRPRRSAPAALATAAALLVAALGAGTATASPDPAADTAADRARAGTPGARGVTLFPTDELTVRDRSQLTGRRVALPTADCTVVVRCGLLERLNTLDGFDLDPRLALRFPGPVDPAAVVAATTVRAADDSGPTIGIDRVVWDADTNTVYAHPAQQLDPGTRYRLQISKNGPAIPNVHTFFTTLSATDGLLDLRRQLDTTAYAAAGQPARGLRVDGTFPLAGASIVQLQDRGPAGAAAATAAALAAGQPDPVENGLVPVPVPNASAGTVVLGSYLAPNWLRADRTIPQTPTTDAGPAPVGTSRLPFVLVLPEGTAPVGGWPTTVFGHGFTGQDTNVLLAAATHSRAGVATIATTVVGHGYGPATSYRITPAGGTAVTLPAYARGVDLEPDGVIGSTEGSSTRVGSPEAAVGSRDGLRQTALDVMALVREVQRGVDVDGVPGADLATTGTGYFGQSFGGIYGTMIAGADPRVTRSVLNVPGGPISEIARLSPAFRLLTTQALAQAQLLNGGPSGFTESLPLKGQPPVLVPAPGALAVQDYLALSTWVTRPGSPETFAPLVRDEDALFQIARGDQTVPNPTAFALLQAGGLFARASLYRNDLSPEGRDAAGVPTNPHGFLLNLTGFPVASAQAQAQILAFLTSGDTVDPDGPTGALWEVPVDDPLGLRTLGFVGPVNNEPLA